MWQSQDDVIKDLAALDDFNVPGDKEPYKVLYPTGRGSKFKGKQRCSSKFLDSRTGEIVSDVEENLDCSDNYEGKGRGRLLGGFSRSGFQLQQQLRLARPLGSGDEAIETYCRKKQLKANSKYSTTSDSDSETKNDEVVSGFSDINLSSETMKHRVKAVRNSSTESNALLSGLLTNSEENTKIKVNPEKEYFINNFDEENVNVAINIRTKNHSISKDSIFETASGCVTDRSSLTDLNDEGVLLKGNLNGKNSNLKSIYSPRTKGNKATQNIDSEDLKIIYSGDREEELQKNKTSEDEYSKNDITYNVRDFNKLQINHDSQSRVLGGGINKLYEIDSEVRKNGVYDFSQISKSIAQATVENSNSNSLE